MHRLHKLACSLFVGIFLLQGCALIGDGVSDAALSGNPEAMAKDGAKLNSRGSDLVKSGESRLVDGRKQVQDGEKMISNGSELVAKARLEYREIAGLSGDASTPDAVSSEARRFKKIGGRWEDAIEMIRDGNSLVTKGNENIERAQSDIRKGRQMMERGSALVRNSRRIQFDETLLPVLD